MLGLLGFYDEFNDAGVRPNGRLRDAVRPAGEADEGKIVTYLDAGHVLLDVMEAGRDVLTGLPHRYSAGCSSLVTDGSWLWRQDFSHYLATHHVALPETFLAHVRDSDYRMPALVCADFAPHYDETMPVVGWSSATPWPLTKEVIQPEPRRV